MSTPGTFFSRAAAAAAAILLLPAAGLRAQGWVDPPTSEQCQAWTSDLAAGGQAAMDAVAYGNLAGCTAAAPGALSGAIRAARASRDTAYLGALAAVAGQVRDPGVFGAALEVTGDGRASDESRVMGLLVIGSSLGASQYLPGYTRPQLFTQALPATGVCGFAAGEGGPVLDNGIPADAERQAARVIDGIRYGGGGAALLQNLARCARSSVDPDIPPQVDVSGIRVDYVCGNDFRVQNHTGTELTLRVTTTAADGTTAAEDLVFPAIGGWTPFTTGATGTVQVSYDGQPVATVANAGRRCGGH
ncbi:hypothetical protein [Longimicrobium sp.]|uniref:hypothetical protein n=1 Tax=Longimicrobium sp. TaxID=2029185 RepID=UPI002C0E3926|nr:hypothetical protein [Longimicrobium sp.]HSU13056.1 hypothetical protein [Longimicrobium sp.]